MNHKESQYLIFPMSSALIITARMPWNKRRQAYYFFLGKRWAYNSQIRQPRKLSGYDIRHNYLHASEVQKFNR